MAEDSLEQAIGLIKKGEKNQARRILTELVRQEPRNDTAWFWLATTLEELERKKYCLERAIALNPDNHQARASMEELGAIVDRPANHNNLSAELSNQFPVNKKTLELIAAACPNCGGELRISPNVRVAKCQYCDYDVIIHDPQRITLEINSDTEKLLVLAKAAVDGKNFKEAYRYYSQILETDPNISEAWLGKGFSAGMLSSLAELRTEEAISCFDRVLFPSKPRLSHKIHEPYDIPEELAKRVAGYLSDIASQLSEQESNDEGELELQWDTEMELLKYSYKLNSNTLVRKKMLIIAESMMNLAKLNYLQAKKVSSEMGRNMFYILEGQSNLLEMYFQSAGIHNDPEVEKVLRIDTEVSIPHLKSKKRVIGGLTTSDITILILLIAIILSAGICYLSGIM